MPTLRQLATQVSESLSSQACSVQDLLDIADSLSLPLAGRDGGDSADSIAPIINDLVQIATVRGISLKESAEGYTPNAGSTSTAKPKRRSNAGKPKFKQEEPAPQPASPSSSSMQMTGVNDALLSGAMEALRHLEARSKGMQIVFDLVDGRREPQNDFERMLLFKAQEIVAPTHAMSTNFISIENDEICLSLAPVEEPSLEEAFNSVVVGINLADFAPALPASY